MIISNFNNLIYLKNNNQQKSPSFKASAHFIKIGNSYLKNFEQELSPDTVSKLDKSIKVLLNKVTPKRIKELAQVNCYAAAKSKKYFDSLYGENNYTLIAIGRSVASIAETMKYLGADVKIIPLSGLRNGLPKEIPNIDLYKKYLSKIGINLGMLEKNKDKKYILFDYQYSGNSLQNADEFIRKNILNSDPENLIKISINEVLDKDFYTNFHLLFSLNRFKEFSSVGKLNIMNLNNCFKQSNPFTAIEYQSNMAKYLRKIFLYNVFECMKKDTYINSCESELKALYNHYLSDQAMIIRLENILKKESTAIKDNLNK